jgi:small subunit ribosomal protein S5
MPEEKNDRVFEEKAIEISRVSRTVKGGKRISFRALVIVGDKNGRVGIGVGKAGEVATAIRKAVSSAKKHFKNINITKNGSIKREVLSRFGSAKVLLKPAPQGTSIIAGGVVRSVCELSGIKNLVSKSIGSSNKKNIAEATVNGLIEAGS